MHAHLNGKQAVIVGTPMAGEMYPIHVVDGDVAGCFQVSQCNLGVSTSPSMPDAVGAIVTKFAAVDNEKVTCQTCLQSWPKAGYSKGRWKTRKDVNIQCLFCSSSALL